MVRVLICFRPTEKSLRMREMHYKSFQANTFFLHVAKRDELVILVVSVFCSPASFIDVLLMAKDKSLIILKSIYECFEH